MFNKLFIAICLLTTSLPCISSEYRLAKMTYVTLRSHLNLEVFYEYDDQGRLFKVNNEGEQYSIELDYSKIDNGIYRLLVDDRGENAAATF